ncbi:MAG: thioredoxin family protein [Nitrososphaerales archaeon]
MKITDWQKKQEFQRLLGSTGPKMVLLAAKWCGYCARFLAMAGDYESNSELELIDADDPDESLWDEYKIRLVPTIIVFKSGKAVFRKDGKPGIGLQLPDLEEALAATRQES